jgi:hypothetical protein
MVGVVAYGFDAVDEASTERFRFDFAERCTEPDQVRREVVRMAKQARGVLGVSAGG